MIRAIVGAGGKTSLIKKMAMEFAEDGKRVFVTTSTRMYIEEDTVISKSEDEMIEVLEKEGYLMAGTKYGTKIGPLAEDAYKRICEKADEVLIEADGSKHLPLKMPNNDEPAIYSNVEEIIIVCGLHGLDKKAKDAVHRWELLEGVNGMSGDDIVIPSKLQEILMKGYVNPLREKYEDKNIVIHPVHDGTMYQRALASLIENEMDVNLINKEWFKPQPTLIVCGGGHVSCELVKIAAGLDFKIKVIDDRYEFANEQRFPDADQVICDSFDNFKEYMEPGAYYIVVSRGHKDDHKCVREILNTSYEYIGMIGSKLKVSKTFENLAAEGFPKEKIDHIFAPIGIEINAVTPAEIAVSIMAEVIREKNKKHSASVSRELLGAKEDGVLCIIIDKKGSSPRGIGSMMFVTKEKVYDSIGGGAVEHAAIEDAASCIKPEIREYHLNNKDSERLGMICGGSNTVLFIPVK